MIVVITSCAPTVAFSTPATAAIAAPARAASTITRKMCSPFAMPAHEEPTQTATIAPVMYWPCPPMLNRPQRNAKATASPVRISVVVRISVCERLYGASAFEFVSHQKKTRCDVNGKIDVVVAEVEEPVQPGAVPHRLVGLERVVTRGEHDEAAREERDRRREDRRDDPARPLREGKARGRARADAVGVAVRRCDAACVVRELAHTAASLLPPVIAIPSCSSVTLGSYSPTIRPS